LYFFIIKDASLEKKIMNIKDYDRMFLFPKKGNMNFLNLPVSYQNTVNNRKNCYFYKNINNSYELERYVKMDIQKGRTLAGNKNFNSIARWNNMFLFNFLPSEDNTNFILKPFVYEKFRNWIYKNKKSNYHLNNKEVLIIKKDFNNIYFNDENINHLIEKNKLKINKLNQTGFLKIHTDKGLIYKSINQYLTEYKNFTGKKDNKKPDLGKTLKIELWKLFLIFSLILFFIETFMFIKERGIFSE